MFQISFLFWWRLNNALLSSYTLLILDSEIQINLYLLTITEC